MCAVSMVTQSFFDRWPNPVTFPHVEYGPYTELVRKARLYDEMTKQPDCPEPLKAEWAVAVEKLMREKYGLEPKA